MKEKRHQRKEKKSRARMKFFNKRLLAFLILAAQVPSNVANKDEVELTPKELIMYTVTVIHHKYMWFWKFSQNLLRTKIPVELCDYADLELMKYCPPVVPPMLIHQDGRGSRGPQMDPALISMCLDQPEAPECEFLGQSGSVTKSPSSFVNDMPSGTRPG